MELPVRELVATDREAADRLRTEAFGAAMVPGPRRPWPHPGATAYGTEEDGELVGTTYVRRYHSHFHGRELMTCGVAGVTVAAHRRGAGLLAPMLEPALAEQRAEGAVIATLFPSQPGIYRRFGFEVITECSWLELPLSGIAALSTPGSRELDLADDEVELVRAGRADLDAIRDCYTAWAQRHNGPLTRRGVSFPPPVEPTDAAGLLGVTECYLARDAAGRVVGYIGIDRGDGVGAGVGIEVGDLIALTPAARAALLRLVGGFVAVAGTVRLRVCGADETLWHRRGGAGRRDPRPAYMLAVLDVVAALEAFEPPPSLRGGYEIEVAGPGPTARRYRLDVADGRVSAERAGPSDRSVPIFTRRGLALWWSGAAGPAAVRAQGLAAGPSDHDHDLGALPGTRTVAVLDAF